MIYYLDTNICVYYLNNSVPGVAMMLEKTHVNRIRIPSMVAAELLFGAKKSAKRDQNIKVVETFLSLYRIEAFDHRAARLYAAIRAELERGGVVIGGNDLVIAATTLANEGTLVTHNTKEFRRVHGLEVFDWAAEQSSWS